MKTNRVKVRLGESASTQRLYTLDTLATPGAVLGENLYLEDGVTVITREMLIPPPSDIPQNPGPVYWRFLQEIPVNVVALAETDTAGIYVVTDPVAGTSETREIQPTVGRTTVANGDGVAGDPVIDLAVVVDSGVGAALMKRTIDSWGRVSGSEAATTDDLTEGVTNLYFTDLRAQDAVGGILADDGNVTLVYGGGAITAALSPAVLASLALADTSLQEAPIDGSTYGRKDGAWVVVSGGGGGGGTVTSITAGTGLDATPNPITGSGTIELDSVSIASLNLADTALQPSDVDTMAYEDAADYTPTSGLGSAAFTSSAAYATAAQGVLAGTALQPTDIGVTVQGWNANLDAWALLTTASKENALAAGTAAQYYRGDKSWQTLNAAAVAGLTAFATLATGTNLQYVRGDGVLATLPAAGSGTVTSVDASGGATGMSFSGGPVTVSGTLTLAGTLAVANGGTGGTTQATARTGLGLVIGTNVQAWDADLDAWALISPSSKADDSAVVHLTGNEAIAGLKIFVGGASVLSGAAGTFRHISVWTGLTSRWGFGVNEDAEGGANSGSNFVVRRYNDAGTLVGDALFMNRATGVMELAARPVFAGNTPWDGANLPVASGSYTPTYTGVSNVTTASNVAMRYSRVGNEVTITGSFNVIPTTINTSTVVRFTLPIAATFANNNAVGGSGSAMAAAAAQHVAVSFRADSAMGEVAMLASFPVAGTYAVRFSLTYYL